MGRFSGLASIKTNQGGLWFLEGDYEVDIQEIKFFENRDGIMTFIVNAKIVTSSNPDRAPGSCPSQVITLKKKFLETSWGNIKQFAGAILGIDDPDAYKGEIDPTIPGDTVAEATNRFWEETMETMVSDEQPCKDMPLHLNCSTISKKNGDPFTKHVWSPSIRGAAA